MKYSFLLVLILVLISCNETKKQRALPFVGNYDIEYKLVDGKEVIDTVFPQMVDFKYLNQDSVMIKSTDMKGKIWVADFFFTSCPTICPKMTKQMKRLNKMTSDINEHIQYLSFSINPTIDNPTRLKEYIKAHKIKANNWYFFTGDEEATHALGINNFQIYAKDEAGAIGGYAHSEAFVLVDKEGYIRGVYEPATQPGPINQLEKDIRKLLKYEYGID